MIFVNEYSRGCINLSKDYKKYGFVNISFAQMVFSQICR